MGMTYAAYSQSEKERLNSSSGGIFSLLAKSIFSNDGVVYGVAMSDDCTHAEFIRGKNLNDLYRMRGSKYVQAAIGDTYKNLKCDLELGCTVLFSGTVCQINGLKKFLGKEYKKLICVDVMCHGVPSTLLWKKYVEYIEQKHGGSLNYINFRAKNDGWSESGMYERIDSNEIFIPMREDSYMRMFLNDYSLRPSCYKCVPKRNKLSDITLADFWGVSDVIPEMNDDKGVSLVIVRTEEGQHLFDSINKDIVKKKVTYEVGVKMNPADYKSCDRPLERELFYKDLINLDFDKMISKYARVTLLRKIKIRIKRVFRKLQV